MSAVQFFHQMVKLHQFWSSDKDKIFIDVFEGLIDPWMLVPVMFLLAFHSWKVLKACDDLLMSQQFQVLESEQDFVWWKSLPGDCFGIVNEEWLCGFVQESIADGYSDGELQWLIFEVGWPHHCFQLILFRIFAIPFESLVKIFYFSRFGSGSNIVERSEGKGIELVDNRGSNFEHLIVCIYYL